MGRKTLEIVHCNSGFIARWKELPKKMYCSGVAHGLPTLKHMGRFIRELDVCVRWQVAWRGRQGKKKKSREKKILWSHLHFFLRHAKHIHLRKVDCLFTARGKSARTSLLCPDENAFTAPLQCWYANYFMGWKNSGWHFHHSYLIVLYFPGNANMAKVAMVVEQWEGVTSACLS